MNIPSAVNRLSRWLLSLILLGAFAAALAYESTYRAGEAGVEAWLVRVCSPVRAVAQAGSGTVWTGLGTSHITGFTVTPLCSSAPLVAGFCVLTALLLFARRWSVRTVLTGVAAAVGVVVLANMLRLSVVIAATHFWHQSGFEWSHNYVGTFISVAGLVGGASLYLMILLRHRPAHRRGWSL